ncbi:MAG TPA: hypothetical protein VJ461_03835 [Candidatus Nanoarchaeia archaeon]|nr:hypothetical protein [Candidatus Nanoarchaeia archaeon]
MKIQLFYEKDYSKPIKRYGEKNFKKIPEHITNLLKSAEDYEIGSFSYEGHDHVALCNRLKKSGSKPFSIILFQDFLDDSHWDDENYQNIEEVTLLSELDEKVFRLFGNEINKKQAEFLDSIKDEKDSKRKAVLEEQNINHLLESYYSKAFEVLVAEHKDFYRGFWRKKFDEKRIREPRKEKRYTRILNLPKPLSTFNELSFEQQLYFVPGQKVFVRGRGSGSYTRFIHSLFGFAFALYQQEHEKIPTHIMVYDKHNELKHVDSLDSLCLMSESLGSNYDYTKETREKLLENVLLCRTTDFLDR